MMSVRRRSGFVFTSLATLHILASCTGPGVSTNRQEAPSANASHFDPTRLVDLSSVTPVVVHRDASTQQPTFFRFEPSRQTGFQAPETATLNDVAWSTVHRLRETFHLTEGALATLRLVDVQAPPRGPKLVRFLQTVDGIDVFQSSLTVLLGESMEPVAASGRLSPLAHNGWEATFTQSPEQCIAVASIPFPGADDVEPIRAGGKDDAGYMHFNFVSRLGAVSPSTARVKTVFYSHPKRLEAAYYIEVDWKDSDKPDGSLRAFIVSAESGEVLFENDLVAADAYSYRVFADPKPPHFPYDGPQGFAGSPHPTGTPGTFEASFLEPELVTVEHGLISTGDPWLPSDATDLTGNNVTAYADLHAPDGFNAVSTGTQQADGGVPADADVDATVDGSEADSGTGAPMDDGSVSDGSDSDGSTDAGALDDASLDASLDAGLPGDPDASPDASPNTSADATTDASTEPPKPDLRPAITSDRTFDRTYKLTSNPEDHVDNVLASTTNLFYILNFLHDWFYDAGWTETAANPQRSNYGRGGVEGDPILAESQDYSGRNNANASTPADGKSPRIQMYIFDGETKSRVLIKAPSDLAKPDETKAASFGPKSFDVSGDLVLVEDAKAPTTDGCEDFVNATALQGKIALIDRGSCSFALKIEKAQQAGALGVLIANNADTGLPGMGGTSATVTIPSLGISKAAGEAFRAKLAAGPVTITMQREPTIDRDGSLDATVVAHEWGHVLSNRLIGNGNGLSNRQGRGMGEGWSDFVALLMTVRPEDTAVAGNESFGGVYGLATYDSPGTRGSYFGIRRVPYSVDVTKNALTLKHIQEGTALPAGVPTAFGADGNGNAEVHATGEVWASMLWECYVALLRDKERLPFSEAQTRMRQYLVASLKLTPPSPTILEARDALLAAAYATDKRDFYLFAGAFARRGAGTGAVGPARDSVTLTGVTESFVAGNDLSIESTVLEENANACDGDGVLDNGEDGEIRIRVKNRGIYPLAATSAVVSATTPAAVFAHQGVVSFPVLQPFESTEVRLGVRLNNAAPVVPVDFQITVSDPSLSKPGPLNASFSAVCNYDVLPASSALETFDDPSPVWTTGGDGTLAAKEPWAPGKTGLKGYFGIEDHNATSDQWLVTPLLAVGASGDFNFELHHRYQFEADLTAGKEIYYDGGVIEISEDDGVTWKDIGAAAGYGPLLTEGTENSKSTNPLRGRPAFVGKSTGYPAFTTSKISLGSDYQGKTIRLRFRVGTDQGSGDEGWRIEEVSFANLANTPFPSRAGDRALCKNRPPVPGDGSALDLRVPERSSVALQSGLRDPEGDSLRWAWTQVEGPSVALSDPAVESPTLTTPEVTGDTRMVFEATATDPQGHTSNAVVSLTVFNVNRPPTARAGNSSEATVGSIITLDGRGSEDPDGDFLTYSWTQVGGSPVTLENALSATPSFQVPSSALGTTYWFALTVSDGTLTSAPASVGIRVADPSGASNAGVLATNGNNTASSPKAEGSGSGCTVSSGPSSRGSYGWFAAAALLLAKLRMRLGRRKHR